MSKSLYHIAGITIGAAALLYMPHACENSPEAQLTTPQTQELYQPTPDPCKTEYVFHPDCNEIQPIVEKPDFSRQEIKTLDTLITE